MGLIDLLGNDATCPLCGSNSAKKFISFWSCPNRECVNGGAKPMPKPRLQRAPSEWPVDPDFKPGADAVPVRYKNFAGEERTFTGDRRSLRERGAHVSLRVAPSGERVALAKERILNLPEVAALLAAEAETGPERTGRENQILGYHRKHKSTSPALEEVLKRHPGWR